MTEEVRALTDELRAVRIELRKVLGRLTKEQRRTRWHRAGSVLLAALLVVVGIVGYRDTQERERAEYRQCIAANSTRADIRASIVETVLVAGADSDDPDRIAALIERIQERLVETIPDRDC